MARFLNRYRVESTRMVGWDYAAEAWYFVTICTNLRTHFFGTVTDGAMCLSEEGEVADRELRETASRLPWICLDAYVVMPNHVHFLVGLSSIRQVRKDAPGDVVRGFGPLQRASLSSIVNHYKGRVTRHLHRMGHAEFEWQPRFHDRVVRCEQELVGRRKYIEDNPAKWHLDSLSRPFPAAGLKIGSKPLSRSETRRARHPPRS
jgi:putative transposase